MKNISEVKETFEWGEKRVYVLMAITRQKENEDVTANTRNIHRSVVRKEDELGESIEHLRKVCSEDDDYNYRLYISANARDSTKAALVLRDKINRMLRDIRRGNESGHKFFKKTDSEFRSVLQKPECKDDKYFLFDLDETSAEDVKEFKNRIEGETEVKIVVETPNGHHVLTEPFHFTQEFDNIDVELKKDGMLYLGRL